MNTQKEVREQIASAMPVMLYDIAKIADSLERIAETLGKPKDLMSQRIAAYNRIEKGIKELNELSKSIAESIDQGQTLTMIEKDVLDDWSDCCQAIIETLRG